jgi:hypothetical protein
LQNLADRRLKAVMPIEIAANKDGRPYGALTHLEALGRLLCGIAPWLEGAGGEDGETTAREQLRELAREALDAATDPASPDYLEFKDHFQPVVDGSFLCLGLLRAKTQLWEALEPRVQGQVIKAMKLTRSIRPYFNNWLLFSGMIETFLREVGEPDWDRMRIDYGFRQLEQWYLGDGMYGDGPEFHWDYYNSYVIQPYLVEMIERLHAEHPEWAAMREPILARARRYAAVLERMISPEGHFPALGRSIAYRGGAFHHLALMALRQDLPDTLQPAQVREALHAVQHNIMEAPGTWDEGGWLRIGLYGHQPGLGEPYISTGSLYLCSFALLPLGLPPTAPFWADPPAPWTAQQLAAGVDVQADKAIPT